MEIEWSASVVMKLEMKSIAQVSVHLSFDHSKTFQRFATKQLIPKFISFYKINKTIEPVQHKCDTTCIIRVEDLFW